MMYRFLIPAVALSLWCTTSAMAQTAEGNLTLRTGFESQDGLYTDLVAQSGAPGSHRLGLRLRGGLTRERFIGGYNVDQGTTLEVAPRAFWTLLDHDVTRFGVLTEVGVRRVTSRSATPAGSSSLALTTRISPTLTRATSAHTEIFAAVHIDTDLALSPGRELDTVAQPIELGARYWLNEHLALDATGMVGGAFGYGGDGVKVRWGGGVNVSYLFEAREPRTGALLDAASDGKPHRHVVPFVDAGWRGYLIGGHASHGPEVRFGAMVWKQRIKVGMAVLNRPGPMNPKTFALDLEEGTTYNGKSTLDLRSDGSSFGLLLAPQIPLGESPWSIELPIMLGQAGYGFYLHGEDRETPDGRRVSEWENELQDDQDSNFSLAVDAGARIKVKLGDRDWLQPMIGVHYLLTPGYDSFFADDYGGLSIAAGVQLALF